jgi:hypothetical protein
MAGGYSGTKKCGIDLGSLPTTTNDNYRQFYLGINEGADAYRMVDGAHRALEDGPPGETVEYLAGWHFGYDWSMSADSDCGGIAVVTQSG